MQTTKLYRPVNKVELDLIQQTDWKKFPPRLPDQPIFYPVTNQAYASQITKEWNLPSYKNGFVTEFELSSDYLSKFKVEKVGLDHFTELWVPAEELEEFNAQIIGAIKVIEAYHSHPENQYIMVADVFKMQEEHVVAFEFINKDSNFEINENSKIENYSLQNYLEMPRKLKSNGEVDMETFIVKFKERYEVNPLHENKVYLLT